MDADDVVSALLARLPRAIVPLSELEVDQDALRAAVASGAVEIWLSLGSVVLGQSEAVKRGLFLRTPTNPDVEDPDNWRWTRKLRSEKCSQAVLSERLGEPATLDPELPDESEVLDQIAKPKARGWKRWREQGDRSKLLPRHILETSPWSPAIEHPPNGKPCACCGGRALGLLDLCLACLASGLDMYLSKPKPLPRSTYIPDPVLKGGLGR